MPEKRYKNWQSYILTFCAFLFLCFLRLILISCSGLLILLIIRGEDSFARAQLAGKPFIWNIYPQTEDTHIHKLTAFEDRLKPFLFSKEFRAFERN